MYRISEHEALEKLGAKNFREVSKEMVMNLFSMIPDMDPEVAKKALEQFPHFVTCAKESIGQYKETIIKALDTADENVKSVIQGRLILVESLSKILERETITHEERCDIVKFINEANDSNSEELDKQWGRIGEVIEMFGVFLMGTVLVAATVLGGRARA